MTTFQLRTRHGDELGETSAPVVWVPGDVIPRDDHNLRIVAVYPPATESANGAIIVEEDSPKPILVTATSN